MKTKTKQIALGLAILFASAIGINSVIAAASIQSISADPVKCPDGKDDCVEVETPNGTFYFHKGNPIGIAE